MASVSFTIDVDARQFIRAAGELADCHHDLPVDLKNGIEFMLSNADSFWPAVWPGGPSLSRDDLGRWEAVLNGAVKELLSDARIYSGGWEGDEWQSRSRGR